MNIDDIKLQLPLTDSKLSKLMDMCEKFSRLGPVDIEIRDLIEELIKKERTTLDKIAYALFEDKSPVNSVFTPKSKIYFPICKTPSDLDNFFKHINIPSLKIYSEDLFTIFDKFQPYQQGYDYINSLRDYSNLGHSVLISITKKEIIEGLQIGYAKIIAQNINFKFVKIGNIEIDELIVKNGEIVNGDFDDNLKKILNYKFCFYKVGEQTDIILLCKQGIELIKSIVTSI